MSSDSDRKVAGEAFWEDDFGPPEGYFETRPYHEDLGGGYDAASKLPFLTSISAFENHPMCSSGRSELLPNKNQPP